MKYFPFLLKIFAIFLLLSLSEAKAQVRSKDSLYNIWMFDVGYQGLVPGADMKDRFGFTSTLGGTVGYKFGNNFYLKAGASYLFGNRVKEDSILKPIDVGNGYIITDGGEVLPYYLRETGITIPLVVGKVFPTSFFSNKNSGIYAELGANFLQHKIWIQSLRDRSSALSPTYKKGYDRLTNGIGPTESIGIRWFDNQNRYNFSAGFVFSQNFTQNRRSINIDTGIQDTKQRLDLLYGFQVSWCVPVYKQRKGSKIIYY